MSLALMVKLAARLRTLDEVEFIALKQLVESGDEDEDHLNAISQALVDCIDISEAHNLRPALRLVR